MARTIRCPKCGLLQMARETCKKCATPLSMPTAVPDAPYAPPRAGSAEPARRPASRDPASLDAVFDRDRFLLRQKVLSIHEKYDVWSEEGEPIVFVERPGRHLRNFGALFAGVGVGAIVFFGFGWASTSLEAPGLLALGILPAILALLVVATALSAKRHLYFYRDESRSEPLLEVLQDRKFYWLTHTYTVREPAGATLALLSKNLLTDIFRKRWEWRDAAGRLVCVAKEDTVLKAILRRFVTRLIPLNFVFEQPGSPMPLGGFDRKFTLFDRYVLDLSADRKRMLDRRVALALGVMLDTGERR